MTNRKRSLPPCSLQTSFYPSQDVYEIGVDEAGRGPLFGRVYTAAVVLPRDGSFDCTDIKDSKKFHSVKKIQAVAEYIRNHAFAYSIDFKSEKEIDEMNILQATQACMHTSIQNVLTQLRSKMVDSMDSSSICILVDGNYFQPFQEEVTGTVIPHETIVEGDNTLVSIACASILAKVARDQYIAMMCEEYPELNTKYHLLSNKGYGTKQHREGIALYGTSPWHRLSFRPCLAVASVKMHTLQPQEIEK